MAIYVRAVRHGIFWDKVQFVATKHHEAYFETLIGEKVFWVNKGDCVTLRMSKDDFWEVGDRARSLSALITCHNQTKFPWDWA
jgi:hypothetical protein